MKNNIFISLILVLFIISCSNDSEANAISNDGTGGSLAIFALNGNYLYTVDNQN